MTLSELSSVLTDGARKDAEVRQESKSRGGFDIVCQGAGSRVYGHKEVVRVYPVVFYDEEKPSLIIWVKDKEDRHAHRKNG